jgi:hypothetical protein
MIFTVWSRMNQDNLNSIQIELDLCNSFGKLMILNNFAHYFYLKQGGKND